MAVTCTLYSCVIGGTISGSDARNRVRYILSSDSTVCHHFRKLLSSLTARLMGVLADVRLYLCVWHPHLLRQIHSLDFFLFSSKYELPKRKKTASLLTKLYSKKYDELVRDLAKIDHVALTSDIWTSRAVQIFQTITCHYITPSWEMKSVVLETVEMAESHTAENIASALQKGVERFGTKEKIVAIATDNAANVVAAVRDLGCNRVACFAHTLNLIDSKRS